MDNYYSYSYDPQQDFQKRMKAISVIRKHGNLSGGATLFFLLASTALAFGIKLFNLTSYFINDEVFSECFDILFTIFGIFVPFMFVMFRARRYHSDVSFSLEKPRDKTLALWAIPTGLMLCFVGDRIASIISAVFSFFGVELTSTSTSLPNSGTAMVLYFVSAVIVAPLVEEFAMRGVVMQPLRKYGEKFAIVMTAIVFALMHQNMVQGIFAFVAGVVFGYICILTGSVWCSVVIHCLNNLMSVLSMYASRASATGSDVVFYNFLVIMIYVLGFVGFVLIMKNSKRPKLRKCVINGLKTKDKAGAFLLAPTMLIAIILMAINCLF